MRSAGEVDLAALDRPLAKLCLNCDLRDTPDCREAACLAGFARKVLKFAISKGILDIPGAAGLIPGHDFKPYYPEMIAAGLAETCRQCRECRDNHSPDCVISLVRHSLENMILTENIDYPGSVFAYLAAVKERNPDLAASLAKQLRSGQNSA
ncbi:hypothetical protein A6M21_09150 [Desulfotomaculum copahuensis]|uniref:Uncharacterized protein n=1 Tax=Desulfotomaculum copahuensis TaxID=1838280 RepID=A0A1B7LFM0_9FIRM|nr:hypothetical protein A6M21_09150 [Desulfotomaculum copahuensis]